MRNQDQIVFSVGWSLWLEIANNSGLRYVMLGLHTFHTLEPTLIFAIKSILSNPNPKYTDSSKNSRFVVDDCVDCVSKTFRRHEVQVENNCSSFFFHMDHVVWLVSKHGDAHNGNAMVDGFINPVCASMGDESSSFRVT